MVGIVLQEVVSGSACRIRAIATEKGCPLQEFLTKLSEKNPNEFSKIMAVLRRTADHGVPKNQQKARYFRDIDCFELKTTGGVRIMAFWDEGHLIVCSHGFIKKSQKTRKSEKDRARDARNEYFLARKRGVVALD